jgi:hypothetical protein
MIAAALASMWIIPAASAVFAGIVAGWFGAVAAAVLAWRLVGWRAGLSVLAAGLTLFAFRSGERRGATIQSAKEKADAERRAVARERTQEDVRRAPDDELRRRASRWVRDE